MLLNDARDEGFKGWTELQIMVMLISRSDQRAMSTPVTGWEVVSKSVYRSLSVHFEAFCTGMVWLSYIFRHFREWIGGKLLRSRKKHPCLLKRRLVTSS
jgi:hypothetical protein